MSESTSIAPSSRASAWRQRVPGFAVAVLVAVVAFAIAAVLPGPVGAVPLAVVGGVLLRQTIPGDAVEPGLAFASKQILQVGIVLLGARLSLGDVVSLGAAAVGLVVATVVVGATTAVTIGRAVGLSRELGTLLGVGSAVCGNTAIMASAPVIRAKARDVSLAVATITLCGTLAVLFYPVLGRALGLDDTTFGIWVGLAVQDTSQVVATGTAFSDGARDVATVVKLIRNTSLAAILPLLAWWWHRTGASAVDGASPSIRKAFPTFILGFLALAGLRTAGVIDDDLGASFGELANWAILVAVSALGLRVRFAELRDAELRSIGVGVATAAILGGVALGAAVLVAPLL